MRKGILHHHVGAIFVHCNPRQYNFWELCQWVDDLMFLSLDMTDIMMWRNDMRIWKGRINNLTKLEKYLDFWVLKIALFSVLKATCKFSIWTYSLLGF